MATLQERIKSQMSGKPLETSAKTGIGKYKKDINSIAKQINDLVDRYVEETGADWHMAKLDVSNAILAAQQKLAK